jgi:hypothetical protein
MQNNILIIVGKAVHEFASLRDLLDFTILAMKAETQAKPVEPLVEQEPKGQAKERRVDAVIAKITEPEKAKAEAKPEPERATPNSYGLPPMRKPFFGGMDKANLLSFSYTVNGMSPSARPADTCRILFTKTTAYRDMPAKEKDKVLNWGLSFLKKQVRDDHKPHSCETTMLEAYAIDRFSFLAGASIRFTIAIKE